MITLATSLLDRLIDSEPDLAVEQPRTRGEEQRQLRDGIRRDLEALLNTRRLCTTLPGSLEALHAALPNYGVDDFVGAPMATSSQRAALATALETAIGVFEPRFSSVKVTIAKARDPSERMIRIHIQAIARLTTMPEPLAFTMALDPAIRKFSGEDRGDG